MHTIHFNESNGSKFFMGIERFFQLCRTFSSFLSTNRKHISAAMNIGKWIFVVELYSDSAERDQNAFFSKAKIAMANFHTTLVESKGDAKILLLRMWNVFKMSLNIAKAILHFREIICMWRNSRFQYQQNLSEKVKQMLN